MTTVEVTTTALPTDPARLLSLRVTPEQEVAIYAFFQINGWTIITEDVPKNCETCQRSINGEGVDPPRCQMCQKALDGSNEVTSNETTDAQALSTAPRIVHVQDQQGRKVVVVGNAMTMAPQQVGAKQQQVQVDIVKEIPAANEIEVSQVVKQVVDPKPQIYNINNSSENRPYRCDDCGKHFRKKSHVVAHMRFHNGETLPKCNICGKEFLYKHNLISHATIHSGERPFECTMCTKNFRRKDDLQVHLRTHTGERPYKCEICGKCFTTQNQLPKHRRTHTGERPYECSQCNKCFRTKPHLEKHLRTHSGERPYKCTECGRAFTQNAHLMAHLRIHSGEKPFECDLCPKRFKESKTLKKHREIHIKGMPYTCKICGKGFLRQQNLEVHMCVHSEDEPKYKRRLREKRELMERIRREVEEDLEEQMLVQEEAVNDEMDEALGVTIMDENGQTIRVVENGALRPDGSIQEGGEIQYQSEEGCPTIIKVESDEITEHQGDNANTSIASSLLTLVEMITNADQGSSKTIQVTSADVNTQGNLVESGQHIVTSASNVQDAISQAQVPNNSSTLESSEPEVTNIQNVMTAPHTTVPVKQESPGVTQLVHSGAVISEANNMQQVLEVVTPGSQLAEHTELGEGLVITEVTDDNIAMAEQIIEHVQQGQDFGHGETFVMEVQYVEEGSEEAVTTTE